MGLLDMFGKKKKVNKDEVYEPFRGSGESGSSESSARSHAPPARAGYFFAAATEPSSPGRQREIEAVLGSEIRVAEMEARRTVTVIHPDRPPAQPQVARMGWASPPPPISLQRSNAFRRPARLQEENRSRPSNRADYRDLEYCPTVALQQRADAVRRPERVPREALRQNNQVAPQGYTQGYIQGYSRGYSQGNSQRYAQGSSRGNAQGYTQGNPQDNYQGNYQDNPLGIYYGTIPRQRDNAARRNGRGQNEQ
ncbi:hypothetical protein QBC33DRAFT_557795 [Phialemonium atrogriseum]|uniref:Uncharacterized protein n=1 Tax=Phialemonium atrogriseum TaxID=1093897 RepID=A0AAJ0C1U3_9PEZI|nr:uncharacterized protein QBC33DRAFT_557795 [Phialemonium atrogriseum]KAK1768331.1 hypothetical protein QBC33DRAFT_557795 [Phialemonium atrogriseum]